MAATVTAMEQGNAQGGKPESLPAMVSCKCEVHKVSWGPVKPLFCCLVKFHSWLPRPCLNQQIWFNLSGDKQALAQPCADLGEELLSSI